MKNKLIRERFAGLVGMSQRALPSPTSENKVHFLLIDRLQKPYEITEELRKSVLKLFPAPNEDDVPASILEARQKAMDERMELDTPVRKIPDHMRIKSADMPKPLKGEEGWKNASGNVEIKRLLGSLYVREGDELVKDQPDGFEADEIEEPSEDPMAEHTAAE